MNNWLTIEVVNFMTPLIVLFSFYIFALWIKKRFLKRIFHKFDYIKWKRKKEILDIVSDLVFYFVIILGTYLVIEIYLPRNTLYLFSKKVVQTISFITLLWGLYKTILIFITDFEKKESEKPNKVIFYLKKYIL